MLKVKDNVSLNQLKKYGFEYSNCFKTIDIYDNGKYIIIWKDREILLSADWDEFVNGKVLDILFDMINAGLVEKSWQWGGKMSDKFWLIFLIPTILSFITLIAIFGAETFVALVTPYNQERIDKLDKALLYSAIALCSVIFIDFIAIIIFI